MQQLPPGFQLDQPAQTGPQPAPGVIRGPAPTIDPAQAASLGIQNQRLALDREKAGRDREEAQREREEADRLALARERGLEDSRFQLQNVIEAAKEAKKLSNNFFATGFGADFAKSFGGTSAADVQALLNTIGANTAFDRLQKMREESKTGGALGQVSEIELRLLRDSIASIEQSQSDEQFRKNMDRVIEAYSRVLERLGGPVDADPAAPRRGRNSRTPRITTDPAVEARIKSYLEGD